jgi:hypothetical protein
LGENIDTMEDGMQNSEEERKLKDVKLVMMNKRLLMN